MYGRTPYNARYTCCTSKSAKKELFSVLLNQYSKEYSSYCNLSSMQLNNFLFLLINLLYGRISLNLTMLQLLFYFHFSQLLIANCWFISVKFLAKTCQLSHIENVDDCSWWPVISESGGEPVLVERESRVGIVHLDEIILLLYIEIFLRRYTRRLESDQIFLTRFACPFRFVPYCTSDSWSGTRASPSDMFSFMGAEIVLQVVRDLVPLGLENASSLLLAGSSAGGTGVMLNLDHVHSLVHHSLGKLHFQSLLSHLLR